MVHAGAVSGGRVGGGGERTGKWRGRDAMHRLSKAISSMQTIVLLFLFVFNGKVN